MFDLVDGMQSEARNLQILTKSTHRTHNFVCNRRSICTPCCIACSCPPFPFLPCISFLNCGFMFCWPTVSATLDSQQQQKARYKNLTLNLCMDGGYVHWAYLCVSPSDQLEFRKSLSRIRASNTSRALTFVAHYYCEAGCYIYVNVKYIVLTR